MIDAETDPIEQIEQAGKTLAQVKKQISRRIVGQAEVVDQALTAILSGGHALVVGVPFHPDGAAHDNTRRARRFARQLHGRFGLPVHEVDERYTTTEAAAAGARDLDAASAAIILEQFLGTLP